MRHHGHFCLVCDWLSRGCVGGADLGTPLQRPRQTRRTTDAVVLHGDAQSAYRDLCGDGRGMFLAAASTGLGSDSSRAGVVRGGGDGAVDGGADVREVLEFAFGDSCRPSTGDGRNLQLYAAPGIRGDCVGDDCGAAGGQFVWHVGAGGVRVCAIAVVAMATRGEGDDRQVWRTVRAIPAGGAGVCAVARPGLAAASGGRTIELIESL